jgi:hypothetical protein
MTVFQRKPPKKDLRLRFRQKDSDKTQATPEAAPVIIPLPEPVVSVAPRKRGRPLTGTHKKTAAEIKRAQREKERQKLDSVSLFQQQQLIYDQACRQIEADLSTVIAANDTKKIQEIQDIIRAQGEQREYDAQLVRSKNRPASSGLFIADAPRGMGKLIYGGANIIAVGDKIATIDEDGNAVFAPGKKVTARHDEGGATVQAEDVPDNNEQEDQFHEKEHPIVWSRDPKRNEFDRREQEENVFGSAKTYLEVAVVALLVWNGESFSTLRNAGEELRCKLCARRFWSWKAGRDHLVDSHARRIAPTSTKRTRANQKLVTMALKDREAEIEKEAAANGWRKVGGKWVKAN